MTPIIRDMRRADIPAVAALEAEIYPQPWSPRVFFDELAMDSRVYVVAHDDEGHILGYGGLLLVEDDAHITTIAVAPEARGRGVGRALVEAAEREAIEHECVTMRLEIREDNEASIALFKACGFR
mgnify:CR=1 FL=1